MTGQGNVCVEDRNECEVLPFVALPFAVSEPGAQPENSGEPPLAPQPLPSLSPALGSQSQTKTVGYFSVGAGVQTRIFIFPWQEREAIQAPLSSHIPKAKSSPRL